MNGHSVKITHGYGGDVGVTIDNLNLKNVSGYAVKGEPGSLPEVTITLRASSVVYETELHEK
ncbi:MAG: hypothetical protein IJF03_09900 [Lachnospiraceae bacterium]|nr:hypothetical protein [Lachnospiraceae bacterium]